MRSTEGKRKAGCPLHPHIQLSCFSQEIKGNDTDTWTNFNLTACFGTQARVRLETCSSSVLTKLCSSTRRRESECFFLKKLAKPLSGSSARLSVSDITGKNGQIGMATRGRQLFFTLRSYCLPPHQ